MDDLEAKSLVKAKYKPEEWNNDIAEGWESFRNNMIIQMDHDSVDANKLIQTLTANVCFPKRELTESEHSVALRHILAIEAIAHGKFPCIVLEDDAMVQDELLFFELLKSLCTSTRPRIFYDLADGYIPLAADTSQFHQIGRLQFCPKPVGITRTLMAYAMSPETAKLLLNSIKHYSLPIDMQFQVLLNRLCLPGLSLINSPFVHGSKTKAMVSSIRQH
jgi:hypothetical protein